MLQESAAGTWDLRTVCNFYSLWFELYVAYLVAAGLAVFYKLIRLWSTTPPFFLKKRLNDDAYLKRLESMKISLTQWALFTLAVSALFVSYQTYDDSLHLLISKSINMSALIILIGERATELFPAFAIVLFTLLVRWHVIRRIEYLESARSPQQT